MEGLSAFPEILNSLNECCHNRTCLSAFQSLPLRLSDFTVDIPEPLLHSKRRFCNECGLPLRQAITDEMLDDAQEEHANIAMDNGFKCFYPYHTRRCSIFYKISQRMFRRINQYSACRRNVLNILVYLPYNNCYVTHHQTWRYAPQFIVVEPLLRRILREVVGLFEEQMEDGYYPEYFCIC